MASSMAGMWMEDPGSLSSGNSRLLMIFVGLVALAMVIQAVIVAVMAIGAARTQKRLLSLMTELHGKAMPVIDSTEAIIRDTIPKVKIITENLVETSHMVRAKAQQFDATMTDANVRTRMQVARVDGMVTTALNRTSALADVIHESIRGPVKQVAGLINGVKAGVDVLLSKANGHRGGDL
jgi:pyridoxal/pyridoxine/pyridoxamine kinase